MDADGGVAARALEIGALSAEGIDHQADLAVIATPVSATAEVIAGILASDAWRPDLAITDVGSVKGPLVASIDHPNFVGGHPMAGSEQMGIDGASGDLFVGATWVLTPIGTTDPAAYARVRGISPTSAPAWWTSPRAARLPGGGGLPRPAPDRRHPHGPGRRARPRSTPPCCSWPPAASAT